MAVAARLTGIALLALASAAAAALPPGVRFVPRPGVPVETAALLLSAQEGGPLALSVQAVALPGGADPAGAVPVALLVEAAGAALVGPAPADDGADAGELAVEVAAYALAGDTLRGAFDRALVIDRARHAAALRAGGLRFTSALRLPPGDYELRVLVRVPASGVVGLRRLALSVPAAGVAALLAPQLNAPPAAGWLTVSDPLAPPAATGRGLAAAVLVAGQALHFELPVVGLLPVDGRLRVELRPLRGAAREITGTTGEGRDASGGPFLTFDGEAPADLAPGRYRLVVAWGELAAPSAEVFVRQAPSGSAEGNEVASQPWPLLATGEATDELVALRPSDLGLAPVRRPRADLTALDAELRRVLQTAGDRATLGAAVAAWESVVLLGSPPQATLESLEEVEGALAQSLARDPLALTALAGVMAAARQSHQVARRSWVTAHAERQAAALLEQAGRASADLPTVRLAAVQGLVGLAGRLFLGGARAASDALCETALGFAPGHLPARLLLAQNAEMRGETAEALRRLADLGPAAAAAAAPADQIAEAARAEALLRRGVNRARRGDRRSAERDLARLADDTGAARWLRLVAYEERARLWLATGDAKGRQTAAAVLTAGRREFPAAQSLQLLAASLADRQGDAGAARAALAAVDVTLNPLAPESGDDHAPSPRRRYGQLAASVEADETAFAAAVEAALPALRAALAAAATAGSGAKP